MMPFADPINSYYETIYRPAVQAADLSPVRADDLFRPSAIVNDLWNMIQRSDVLLADLTTKNANVFYELGLAHAIGKPVVLVSETMLDVPFDLQQLRVILYDRQDPSWGDRLRSTITNAILETLAEPIESVPHSFRIRVASQAPEQDAILSRLSSIEGAIRSLRTADVTRSQRSSHANSDRITKREIIDELRTGGIARDAVIEVLKSLGKTEDEANTITSNWEYNNTVSPYGD